MCPPTCTTSLGEPSLVGHYTGGSEGAGSVVPFGGAQPQSGATSTTSTSETEASIPLKQIADTSEAAPRY